ncbi:hypothetical protein CTI12_AA100680 [Artemisia annua]|uniref:Uncharacterized protein n=2 Tax=Artemisia annua TaxID=35608 RepID=A0A2U1PXG6_ARTAN|nr:hypothetical protein CTI12_AA100680 [Artemisia annua]
MEGEDLSIDVQLPITPLHVSYKTKVSNYLLLDSKVESMDFYPAQGCYNIVQPLANELQDHSHISANFTSENVEYLINYCQQASYLEAENRSSKPISWIGIYIALASFICTLAMAADLVHGFRSRKIWFPCKYFTLNAASITVITVAMKLPVDLSSLMPFYLDQATKVESIAFMCTMMANFMPSLASVDNKTLLANVIGLAILVITMIVNICIQISTGVIVNFNFRLSVTNFMILAYIYMALLFWLLVVLISAAITIPASKQILEFKYQATCKRTLNDQLNNMSAVEKLTQYIRKYWVTAESGSPQFVMASTPLSSTCAIYLMAMLFTPAITSRIDDVNEDLSNCFLKLEDDMELGERTLKRISSSIKHLIQKAEKKQQKDLLVLLDTSTGFKGVENFDNDQVLPLTTVKLVNSWSLPIVTFTCIAIALPNIPKDVVDSLVKSVHEGLLLSHLVEESLNSTSEYGNIRRVTMTLWHEVEANCMWETSVEILEWFAKKAEEIVIQFRGDTNGDAMETTPKELIAANSMYRIAQTIVFNYQGNVEPMSVEELFALLRGMIADIFLACFTNIPRVILMKCHASAIEKRESSVEAAAKLLGRTKEILKRLEVQELPSMDPDKMAFIDEWRAHLRQSIP